MAAATTLTPRRSARLRAKADPDPALVVTGRPGRLPCLAYVVLYHLGGAGGLGYWHHRKFGVVSPLQAALALFCTINAWICVCEIALLRFPDVIRKQHAGFRKQGFDGALPPEIFLFERATAREVLGVRYWTIMWGTYATVDPSYVDTESFGYCVDCCNGVVTLLPTVLFAAGMTLQGELMPARTLGALGLVFFYQMFYGTVGYYFQYFYNRRYAKTPAGLVAGFIVPVNGIWIVFPALGMWACARLIHAGDFEIFL